MIGRRVVDLRKPLRGSGSCVFFIALYLNYSCCLELIYLAFILGDYCTGKSSFAYEISSALRETKPFGSYLLSEGFGLTDTLRDFASFSSRA